MSISRKSGQAATVLLAVVAVPALALAAPHAKKDTMPAPKEEPAPASAPTSEATPPPSESIPPATIDTNSDGKADAWDRNGDGKADAWDTNGDGKPDAADNNGDGLPDPAEAKSY